MNDIPMAPVKVGDTAEHLHRAQRTRHNLQGPLADCEHVIDGAGRCALPPDHSHHQHISIGLDRGTYVVTGVVSAPVRVRRRFPDPTTPVVDGTVIVPGVDGWRSRRVAVRNGDVDPAATVLVDWDDRAGVVEWEQPDQLVVLDQQGQPRYDRLLPADLRQEPARRGLRLRLYKPGWGDPARGRVSSRCWEVTLVGDQVDKVDGAVAEPTVDAPAVELSWRTGILSVVPVAHERGAGPEFGGTFVWTSDDRLAELLAGQGLPDAPLQLHDRWEASTS